MGPIRECDFTHLLVSKRKRSNKITKKRCWLQICKKMVDPHFPPMPYNNWERLLNSGAYRRKHPWIILDIKSFFNSCQFCRDSTDWRTTSRGVWLERVCTAPTSEPIQCIFFKHYPWIYVGPLASSLFLHRNRAYIRLWNYSANLHSYFTIYSIYLVV